MLELLTMIKQTLREAVIEAGNKKVAIGHFNVSDSTGVWAVFNAARKLNVPVIIGVSEGERDFIGVRQIVALVKSIREEFDYPVYLNADHTYTFERVRQAIDAGFDSVIFDGAKLSLEENITQAKECVVYAKASGRDVLVEGELGYIGQSSKILDAIPEGVDLDEVSLTHPEDARRFVEETGVDLLAPAVGNIHGMLKGGSNPSLNIEVVKKVREASGVPLVLHGGSGNSADDFKKAIASGVDIVHINTELRVAYKKGIMLSLQENPEEVAPYKFFKQGLQNMTKLVEEKLTLFNNL